MNYTEQNTAQTVFLNISDILISWIHQALFSFKKLLKFFNLYIFYFLIFILIFMLIIKKFIIKDKKKYILITHRNIKTKKICNILFFEINKNNNKFDIYFNNFNMKIVNTGILNLVFDKKNNIFFFNISSKVKELSDNIAEIEIYKELLNIINAQEVKNIDIFIYDTHERYIDTFCMMFGEKSLITGNRILLKNSHIFYIYLNNILIDFYSIDMLLSNKNIISVLEMLRSLEEDNQALQKIYYYYNNSDLKLDSNNIVFYLLKIAKFLNKTIYYL